MEINNTRVHYNTVNNAYIYKVFILPSLSLSLFKNNCHFEVRNQCPLVEEVTLDHMQEHKHNWKVSHDLRSAEYKNLLSWKNRAKHEQKILTKKRPVYYYTGIILRRKSPAVEAGIELKLRSVGKEFNTRKSGQSHFINRCRNFEYFS